MTLLAAFAILASPPSPAPLAPAGAWRINFGSDLCQARRTFGAGPETVELAANVRVASAGPELILDGASVTGHPRRLTAALTVAPTTRIEALSALVGTLPGPPARPVLKISGTHRFGLDALGAATGLTVEAGGWTRAFATGPLRPVAAQLSACRDQLLADAGAVIRVGDARRVEAVPASDPLAWYRLEDVPYETLARAIDETVVFQLEVGTDGRATACRPLGPAKPTALASSVCRFVTRRARFAPPVDAKDAPTTAWYVSQVINSYPD